VNGLWSFLTESSRQGWRSVSSTVFRNIEGDGSKMHSSRQIAIRIALLAASVISISGCGNSGKHYVIGTISGRVVMDEKPIKSGCVVVFHPVSGDGIFGSGLVVEDGRYVISHDNKPGVPIGNHKVTVSPPPFGEQEQKETDRKNQVTIITALGNRDAKSLKKNLIIPQTDIVPQKYWSQGSSPLKLTVKEGENTGNFELEPENSKP
jgi:hypothetical protein